jgi:hypothetical protein
MDAAFSGYSSDARFLTASIDHLLIVALLRPVRGLWRAIIAESHGRLS